MPLILVNHSESVITLPLSQEHLNPHECIMNLLEHNAEFSILEAGFEGDVTPRCFEEDPRVAPVHFRFRVDETSREKGVLTRTLPPGAPAMFLKRTVDLSSVDFSQRTQETTTTDYAIPDGDKLTQLFGYIPESPRQPWMYMGGLITLVRRREAKVYQHISLARPGPRRQTEVC